LAFGTPRGSRDPRLRTTDLTGASKRQPVCAKEKVRACKDRMHSDPVRYMEIKAKVTKVKQAGELAKIQLSETPPSEQAKLIQVQ